MPKSTLPFREHPARERLLQEAHRFGYEPVEPPMRIVCLLAMREENEAERAHLAKLAATLQASGARLDEETVRLPWQKGQIVVQRHWETMRYLFFLPLQENAVRTGIQSDPLADLPRDWIAQIPGEVLVASEVLCLTAGDREDEELLAQAQLAFGAWPAGSAVGRTRTLVFSDFRLHHGFTRWLVFARSSSAAQVGRTIGRIVEIECYRALALLGLAPARLLLADLPAIEDRIEAVAEALAAGTKPTQEQLSALLNLGLEIERHFARSAHRFAASRAYFEILQQRLGELAETPLGSLPTLRSFLMRRMEHAVETIHSVERRLAQLSTRISAVAELLRTGISVQQEAQTQRLLAAMERRQRLQLRLQQAAELLSVAIFTYYSAHLAADVAELAAHLAGATIDPLLVRGISAPIFAAGAIAWLLRKRRARG